MGYGVMNGNGRADYRFKLAQGFLDETRQDVGLGRWRSAMDNAQLAVENAAKDEMGGLTPWELFDEADANQALKMAEEAVALAEAIIQEITS
jgi:HEPN domain-containing protein